LSDRDIDRLEIWIAYVRFRKARQQPRDRDGDGGAPQDVADAMVRPGPERKDAPWLAVDIEAQRIGKSDRVIVRRKRRRPHHHVFEDAGASYFGVARGDARKGEVTVAGGAVGELRLESLPMRIQ
jgi:hypothetical protein